MNSEKLVRVSQNGALLAVRIALVRKVDKSVADEIIQEAKKILLHEEQPIED